MNPANDLLVKTLEALPLLDGRYKDIKWINFDPVTGAKRGCFSLVFKCHDVLEDKAVALKFYDLDPQRLLDTYRLEAFKREPDILQTLIGNQRCIQLAAGMKTYILQLPLQTGQLFPTPCLYFAVDWVDDQIDGYFERQHQFGPAEKLHLLNEIVLAIEVLHQYEIHHRDVKPDNLRSYQKALQRIVVAIDLVRLVRFFDTS
jgi:serine/threonine protein kinase